MVYSCYFVEGALVYPIISNESMVAKRISRYNQSNSVEKGRVATTVEFPIVTQRNKNGSSPLLACRFPHVIALLELIFLFVRLVHNCVVSLIKNRLLRDRLCLAQRTHPGIITVIAQPKEIMLLSVSSFSGIGALSSPYSHA